MQDYRRKTKGLNEPKTLEHQAFIYGISVEKLEEHRAHGKRCCSTCHKWKLGSTEFHANASKRGSHETRCIECGLKVASRRRVK